MTSKPYPRTPRSSRSSRPFGRHFEALRLGEDEHPVDLTVSRAPEVASLQPRLRRLRDAVQKRVRDRQLFMNYEDLRAEHLVRRQELYFDGGYDHGLLAGRAEPLAAKGTANPATAALTRRLLLLVMAADLPRERVVAVLLEMACGIVLGLRLRARGGKGS